MPGGPQSADVPQGLSSATVANVDTSEPAETPLPPYKRGEYVHVWSNSEKRWYDDGLVLEVVERPRVVQGFKVTRGSVQVRFADKASMKWLVAERALTELRKTLFGWHPLGSEEALPERALLADSSTEEGQVFVARSRKGEIGSLTIADRPGPKSIQSIWTPSDEVSQSGAALVLNPGVAAEWRRALRGEPLPASVITSGIGVSAVVGRNRRGEPGQVDLLEGSGHVDAVHCQRGGRRREDCDVLLLQYTSAELEVQVLRIEGLVDPEYRFGDLTSGLFGLRSARPLVHIELGNAKWRSGYREMPPEAAGNVDLFERAFFPLTQVSQVENMELIVRVVDYRRKSSPLYGSASVKLDAVMSEGCCSCRLELIRGGRIRGQLSLRLALPGRVATSGASTSGIDPSLEVVEEAEVSLLVLKERLHTRIAGVNPDLSRTAELCITTLEEGGNDLGGAVVLIVSTASDVPGASAAPPFEYIDGGASTACFRGVLASAAEDTAKFRRLLASSRSSSGSDFWTASSLEQLVGTLSRQQCEELESKPRGGAWILSPHGTILASGVRLLASGTETRSPGDAGARTDSGVCTSSPTAAPVLRLPRSEQPDEGYRSAVAAVGWMGRKGITGMALLRTDAGTVSAILPNPGGSLVALHVPAIETPKQSSRTQRPGTL